MKVNQKMLDKPIGDFMETLQNPEKQKDLTFGELMELMSIIEHAQKLQNPQGNNSDFEIRLGTLEKKTRMLEAKFSVLYEMVTGGVEDAED